MTTTAMKGHQTPMPMLAPAPVTDRTKDLYLQAQKLSRRFTKSEHTANHLAWAALCERPNLNWERPTRADYYNRMAAVRRTAREAERATERARRAHHVMWELKRRLDTDHHQRTGLGPEEIVAHLP